MGTGLKCWGGVSGSTSEPADGRRGRGLQTGSSRSTRSRVRVGARHRDQVVLVVPPVGPRDPGRPSCRSSRQRQESHSGPCRDRLPVAATDGGAVLRAGRRPACRQGVALAGYEARWAAPQSCRWRTRVRSDGGPTGRRRDPASPSVETGPGDGHAAQWPELRGRSRASEQRPVWGADSEWALGRRAGPGTGSPSVGGHGRECGVSPP